MRAIVTGANSGIGYVAARELARRGHDVVLACRDAAKGEAALVRLRSEVGGAGAADGARLGELDLASLDSVRGFASTIDGVDLLVNNAGVMAPPKRATTTDGFELQLGTNHLGHFALTGLLLEQLREGRVVTVSSNAHKTGKMRWDDLQWERGYSAWAAYGQSKLANLLFALGLARRATEAGWALRSTAAHPGYSATNLQSTGGRLQDAVMKVLNVVVAQSDEMGAEPTLMAALDDLPSGSYVGPGGPGEFRGSPKLVSPTQRAASVEDADRLWAVSEELTGVRYAL